MKCKACDIELEEGVTLCPACGAENAPEAQMLPAEEAVQAEIAESAEAVAEETTEEAPAEENDGSEMSIEEPTVIPQKPKVKIWQVIVGVVASLIVLAALAIVLLYAFGVDIRPRPNDIHKKDSYVVSAEQALKAGSKVVATVNGKELTNGALHIYYRMQVVDFLNANMSYLSYLGLDYSKPLADQPCYYDNTISWEQHFINAAIETWQNYQTIYMLSVADGFVPSEDLILSLEELPAGIEEMAVGEGFDSADAFMQDRFGAPCTMEDYLEYCRVMYVSSEYINIDPSMDDLEAYYAANEDYLVENGAGKDSGPMVNVRHILLTPHEHEEENAEVTDETLATEETTEATVAEETTEATEATEETQATEETVPQEEGFSEEAWAECLANAEAVLDEWKSGDATEESFAELANTYSEDGGSNTTGGLYTGITADASYVENFLAWCMDESRQVGDTGIVQTEYGYHVMYFAYTQPKWLYYAEQSFLTDRVDKMLADAKLQWPMEINYKNIALELLDLS